MPPLFVKISIHPQTECWELNRTDEGFFFPLSCFRISFMRLNHPENKGFGFFVCFFFCKIELLHLLTKKNCDFNKNIHWTHFHCVENVISLGKSTEESKDLYWGSDFSIRLLVYQTCNKNYCATKTSSFCSTEMIANVGLNHAESRSTREHIQ